MKLLYFIGLSIILLLLQSVDARAQKGGIASDENDTLQVITYVHINRAFYKGDSIPNVKLHTFYCNPPLIFKNQKERQRYDRLVANVRYLFPIAQLAKQTLLETYDYLQTLPNEKEKKKHISVVEKGVKEQYAPMVKRMSRSQGKILVKLINRECGQTSYEMVKAFIGPLKAGFYQVLAGMFGNSLSKKYDPEGEDIEIERIVQKVESGQI